jgi:hypothetical protein
VLTLAPVREMMVGNAIIFFSTGAKGLRFTVSGLEKLERESVLRVKEFERREMKHLEEFEQKEIARLKKLEMKKR